MTFLTNDLPRLGLFILTTAHADEEKFAIDWIYVECLNCRKIAEQHLHKRSLSVSDRLSWSICDLGKRSSSKKGFKIHRNPEVETYNG